MKLKHLLRPAKTGIVVFLGLVVCTLASCTKEEPIGDKFEWLLVKTRGIELTSEGVHEIFTLKGTIPPSGASFTVIPEDDIKYRQNATLWDLHIHRTDGKATYPCLWSVTDPFDFSHHNTEIKELTGDWGSVVKNADGEMLNSFDININSNNLGIQREFRFAFVGNSPLVTLDIVLIQDPIEPSE